MQSVEVDALFRLITVYLKNYQKNQEEMSMKRVLTACLAMVFVLTIALSAFAQLPYRDAIKKKVDETVAAINSGKTAGEFKATVKEGHEFVFIMKMDGTMLVHPSLAGKNIKAEHEQMYKAVSKADANGTWVTYEFFPGWNLNSYVRKTKDELIVGCGM